MTTPYSEPIRISLIRLLVLLTQTFTLFVLPLGFFTETGCLGLGESIGGAGVGFVSGHPWGSDGEAGHPCESSWHLWHIARHHSRHPLAFLHPILHHFLEVCLHLSLGLCLHLRHDVVLDFLGCCLPTVLLQYLFSDALHQLHLFVHLGLHGSHVLGDLPTVGVPWDLGWTVHYRFVPVDD